MIKGGGWRAAGLLLCGGVLAVAVLLSLSVGNQLFGAHDVYLALADFSGSDNDRVIRYLRVPRTVAGLLVGVALGLAGALMQGVTRNPLADPGILGVNAGAAVAVVGAIGVLGVTSLTAYVWFAMGGALVATVVVYLVGAIGRGGATPVKLALAGAAISALLGSVTSAITLTDLSTLNEFRFWVVGSLSMASGPVVTQAAPLVAVGILLALVLGRSLNQLALGDELAQSLGTRVLLVRVAAGLAVVVLAGTATAIAGPIGFVGLAVPHVARSLVGADYRWILPWSMVLAPALLLLADVVGRVVVRPAELQVGIITALIGAPLFIALVRRRRTAEL
ncbi:iron chelate uptake ABC transporter family permease subunit [Kribbella sandramycini]|uniref:Iron chelate uptake ABC transporter family permease subunit n=1 Tax=Kribbella sandramycini TaxID=60450 RepID=A0A7Y4L8I4_9ACTN|nr:iron chelate uptake ABC transporter family permease subunit [Kribbella sandramycini]MBB6566121.1 iron complex transport system permease protein [Kribbella sandramycini]NOL45121.1 iron chelate uptake ABC transporter family permease subunit [Kribbella sandramycini]